MKEVAAKPPEPTMEWVVADPRKRVADLKDVVSEFPCMGALSRVLPALLGRLNRCETVKMISFGLAADGKTSPDRMALAAEDVRTICRRIAAAPVQPERPNAQ